MAREFSSACSSDISWRATLAWRSSLSLYVKSEVHGIGNVSIGVPARINRKGVFPVSIMISEDEVNQFKISVEKIKAATADVMNGLDERIAEGE